MDSGITKIVVDAAYHIHRRLGLGLLPIDRRFSLRLCVRSFLLSPSRRLYPPAWKSYGLEAEPEAGLSVLGDYQF